jgi:hypothetical protein
MLCGRRSCCRGQVPSALGWVSSPASVLSKNRFCPNLVDGEFLASAVMAAPQRRVLKQGRGSVSLSSISKTNSIFRKTISWLYLAVAYIVNKVNFRLVFSDEAVFTYRPISARQGTEEGKAHVLFGFLCVCPVFLSWRRRFFCAEAKTYDVLTGLFDGRNFEPVFLHTTVLWSSRPQVILLVVIYAAQKHREYFILFSCWNIRNKIAYKVHP